jgi:uncharacterized protein YndB with AHSA1/START domain
MSIRQHDFTIERRFPQSPEQTFQAFADPELRQRWFRVPDSWTDTEFSLNFRIGGSELSAGRDQRGYHHVFQVVFTTSSTASGSCSPTTCCSTGS